MPLRAGLDRKETSATRRRPQGYWSEPHQTQPPVVAHLFLLWKPIPLSHCIHHKIFLPYIYLKSTFLHLKTIASCPLNSLLRLSYKPHFKYLKPSRCSWTFFISRMNSPSDWTWHLVLWFSEGGGIWSKVGFHHLRGLFPPEWFYDSVKYLSFFS